ncbi:hypothetical protein VNI00_011476 [Paramarasmius palmivorus]|uniref:F-box domain-containing protein n=1 Tax=Paramarasmius palmivorus TaxID=297713 RepID=A0AAW0CCA0_9AGAR
MTMHSSQLPLDIVEKIIKDHIAPKPPSHRFMNRRTINSCSLVSRLWLYAARPHLFFDYSLIVPRNDHRLESLKALYQSPLCTLHLARIETLAIDPSLGETACLAPFLEWYTSTIPESRAKLHSITIDTVKTSLVALFRERVPSEQLSKYASGPALTGVTHLHLNAVYFQACSNVIELFRSFPQLKSLVFTSIIAYPRQVELASQSPGVNVNVNMGQLQTIELDDDSFLYLHPHITFPSLRRLVYTEHRKRFVDPPDTRRSLKNLGDLLQVMGQQLEILELTIKLRANNCVSDSQISKFLDLSTKTPLLQTLRLEIDHKFLFPALSFSRPHPTLTSITLTRGDVDWGICDTILHKSAPGLTHLSIFVIVRTSRLEIHDKHGYNPETMDPEIVLRKKRALKDIQKQMPWSVKRGVGLCPEYYFLLMPMKRERLLGY